MTSEPLNQYTDICKDAIKGSSAKLGKTFENLLLEILLLYIVIQRKIKFTQMERYGTHCEQTYRMNFNRGRAKCINWVKFNLALSRHYLNMDGLLAIAIDPSYMSGEDVLRTYRSRFQIEFCFRDAKQFTGLTHCQARHKNQLDFSYNASFASQNVAKVMMKENGLPYSMASFRELMASTYIAKLIFDKCRNMPNRKLISHTIKELFGWQRKAA